MILSQITRNANKSLPRPLMSYCINRICSLHFKKYYKHESAYHFIHRRGLNISAKSNEPNELYIKPDGGNEINFFVQDRNEYDKSSVTVAEYVKNTYQAPLSDLVTIYNVVHKELNKECLSIKYEKLKNIKCTIDITWPSEKSFSCTALQKKTASHFAALVCLNWLYIHNKINGRKPILHNDEEIISLLKAQKSIDINLKDEFKNEIEFLINKFDNGIKSIMTPCTIEDSEILEVENNDCLYDETQVRMNETRNDELKYHLLVRQSKTESLPIDNYREEILNCLQNNNVFVIKGDTGCGKSTRVPQIIMDAYIQENRAHECNIIVSEPRRVSAVSLARRVARERNEILGNVVGYHVRFDNVQPKINGSILYCTTGILLRRLECDNHLKGISHVIIDEAHERSLQTDMLLKLLKDMLKHNPCMKLIIMSATINAKLFQYYFCCPVIDVPGQVYPVKMHFLEDIPTCKNKLSVRNNFANEEVPYGDVVNLIMWIIENKPPGAILCFLPGWKEIKTLHQLLCKTEKDDIFILPLHSKISNSNQQRVFCSVPDNITKIILSTDIAETGVTIKDVNYVIDTAIKRDVIWNVNKGMSRVEFVPLSRASILQRKGRAGRVRPGESYHFVKKREYYKLDPFPRAEIYKVPLEAAVVSSKLLTKEKAHAFFSDLPEPPYDKALNSAIQVLKNIGILDADENLTNLGKRVSRFTLNPRLSKAIILSAIFHCVEPIMLIATAFSSENKSKYLLDTEMTEGRFLKESLSSLHRTSDHIIAAKYYEGLVHSTNDKMLNKGDEVDYENSTRNVQRLYKLHKETLMSSNFMSLPNNFSMLNTYANCNELIRAILFASTNQLLKRDMYGYKQGYFRKNSKILKDENNIVVNIDRDSINYNRKLWPSDILTYIHKIEYVTRRSCTVFDTSIISPLSVLLFSRGDVQYEEIQEGVIEEKDILIRIKDIENVNFRCNRKTADLLLKLRDILWNIVDFIIEYDGISKQEEGLNLVHAYKCDLMYSLSKMLEESANGFGDEENR